MINPNLVLEADEFKEYFDSSSTYSLNLTIPTSHLPRWFVERYHDVQLLPGYWLSTYLTSPDTVMSLRRLRRNKRKYVIHLYSRKYQGQVFHFKAEVSSQFKTLVTITDLVFFLGYTQKRLNCFHALDLKGRLRDILLDHTKEEVEEALSLQSSKSLEETPMVELLAEVESRYKKELGDRWVEALLPPRKEETVARQIA